MEIIKTNQADSILISIIVPVYNVEQYLEKCIRSIINQTYKLLEIILIDDGSTDFSGDICDRFSKKDSRIHVIHKKNGGLSDARNVGISKATGEYILFVDSDDWIELSTCEKFIEALAIKKVDIVSGNAKRIEDINEEFMKHCDKSNRIVQSGQNYLKEQLRDDKMYMAAWLNLYKRTFLIKNNLYFVKGRLHEDEQFTPRCFLKAKSVVGMEMIFYNYRIRENSITTQDRKEKNALSIIETCKELEKIYEEIKDTELKKLLNNTLVDRYLNAFQIGKLYRKKYNCIINKKFLIGKSYSLRNKRKVFLFIFNKRLYFLINYISKSKGKKNANSNKI